MMKLCIMAAGLCLGGCYSFSTLGRAHTIGAGHVEAFAAPGALLVAPVNRDLSIRPVAELGARVGLSRDVDAEARLTTLGATLAAHVQVVRDRRRFGVELLLAPGVALTSPDKLTFELPLLFGLNLPSQNQLVLAPRIAYQLSFGVPGFSQPISYLFGGASLGFAWRITRQFTLFPELAALTEVYAQPGFTSNLAKAVGLQASTGILVDF